MNLKLVVLCLLCNIQVGDQLKLMYRDSKLFADNIYPEIIGYRDTSAIQETRTTHSSGCIIILHGDGSRDADCSSLELREVPRDLPRDIRKLILYDNSLILQGKDFANYSQLVHLDISRCAIELLSRDSFFNLSKLQELNMKKNNLNNLTEDVYFYLPNLKYLNVECNWKLGLDMVFLALKMAPFSLKALLLDYVGDGTVYELTKDNLGGLDTSDMTWFSIKSRRDIFIDPPALEYLQNITHLSLGINIYLSLIFKQEKYTALYEKLTKYSKITHFDFQTREAIQNERIVTCNDYSPSTLGEFWKPSIAVQNISGKVNVTEFNIGSHNLIKNPPPTLRYVSVTNIPITHNTNSTTDIFINEVNSIQFVNISHNSMPEINVAIHGLSHLEVLDLRSCSIQKISPGSLDYFPSLRYLFLQNNELGPSQVNLGSTFGVLKNLELIDLSNNGLTVIDQCAFCGLHQLRVLNLAKNPFTDLERHFRINSLISLQSLDMGFNSLRTVDSTLMSDLDHVALLHPVSVDLQGNPFVCDCQTISFVKWFQTITSVKQNNLSFVNPETYTCKYRNSSDISLMAVDLTVLSEDCQTILNHNSWLVIASPFIASFCLVIVIIVCYYTRWYLRWWLFKLKHVYICKKRYKQEENKAYDVYVAHAFYSDKALKWTINTLLPVVEEQWDMKLFIWERDSEPGWTISDNIINAIDNSNKTIVVVEPALCDDEWCDFMIQMALINKRLQLVYLEDVHVSLMTPTLRNIMKTGNYIKWPRDTQRHNNQPECTHVMSSDEDHLLLEEEPPSDEDDVVGSDMSEHNITGMSLGDPPHEAFDIDDLSEYNTNSMSELSHEDATSALNMHETESRTNRQARCQSKERIFWKLFKSSVSKAETNLLV